MEGPTPPKASPKPSSFTASLVLHMTRGLNCPHTSWPLGLQLQGVDDSAGSFKDPTILVRQPHDLSARTSSGVEANLRRAKLRTTPPKAGCLTTSHLSRNGTPQLFPLLQSPAGCRYSSPRIHILHSSRNGYDTNWVTI